MSTAPVGIIDPSGPPIASNTERVEITTLPSVWTLDDRITWLIDDIIPRASVNLITAESGTGKTWLAYAIAGAVAHGKKFIDRTVVRASVTYLDGENPLYVVKR